MPFPPCEPAAPNTPGGDPPPPPMDDHKLPAPTPGAKIHSLPCGRRQPDPIAGFRQASPIQLSTTATLAPAWAALGVPKFAKAGIDRGPGRHNAQRDGYNENQWAFSSPASGSSCPSCMCAGRVGREVSQPDDDDGLHVALGGGLGFELVQMADFALGVELAGTWLHLPKADWNSLAPT